MVCSNQPTDDGRPGGLSSLRDGADKSSPPKASIPDAGRCIPDSWFRATASAQTMGMLQQKDLRTVPLSVGEKKLGRFVLPPFQRPPVWSRDQQIRFVESCWLGLPIGAIVYNSPNDYSSTTDQWLLDGQQRVTALYSYMTDDFPVMGHRFSELTIVDHRRWSMGVSLPCLITQLEDVGELAEVYDRLAYGGTPHDPAQRIEARSDETPQAARPEGQEPDGEAVAPNPNQEQSQ